MGERSDSMELSGFNPPMAVSRQPLRWPDMSEAHTSGAQIGGCVGNGHAAAPGAADWLCLAVAPTFAAMALLTWAPGGDADMMCLAAIT